MKKIHLIVQSKDIVSSLEGLRDLGVMHIEHQSELKNKELTDLREEIGRYEEVLGILFRYQPNEDVAQKESANLEARCDLILDRLALVEDYQEAIGNWQGQIDQWKPWGDFNPDEIRDLEENGVYVQLCEIPATNKAETPEGVVLEVISESKKLKRCVAISREAIKLPYDVVRLPSNSLKEIYELQKADEIKLKEVTTKLQENARYIAHVQESLNAKMEELTFLEASAGMKQEGGLSVLKGFCPEESCVALQEEAKKKQWALSVEDVTDQDNVPTLLKNSKIVNLSQPALKVIEILPGYKEFDVSMVFLVFFTFFFGMLVGDAAYGLIFAALTVFVQMKMGKKVKDKTAFHLMYLLTGFTMVWGVLTGTYFGQQWLPSSIKPVMPWLNDANNIQWLCFTVAVAHLSIARIWAAKAKLPQLTALSEIGWLFIVWGMYFVANMFVLNQPMPSYALWFLIIGAPLALFFMVPFKEYNKLPVEIIPFVLAVIGACTDIISYIRLFAVGLATVAVADAANSMPAALPGVGYGLMVFLHMLNLILAAMAILVHAIRLNVLEFSGHLSLEWVGYKYNPFQKRLKQA